MSDIPPKYGFSHHHSIEQLLAYRRVPAEQWVTLRRRE